jgi:hypothetical protein
LDLLQSHWLICLKNQSAEGCLADDFLASVVAVAVAAAVAAAAVALPTLLAVYSDACAA